LGFFFVKIGKTTRPETEVVAWRKKEEEVPWS
jgi:hypothetical protein